MYLDDDAGQILKEAHPNHGSIDANELLLWRIYALLMRAKGEAVTREDVHDAWSVWAAHVQGEHRSMIPFEELDPAVQELDERYVQAIHAVARDRMPVEAQP